MADTKKADTKKADAKTDAPKKPNALQQPMKPSDDLAKVIGKGEMPRSQVVSKMWEYIKKHDLQKDGDRRTIVADENLKKVFGGKAEVSMFEMNKHVSNHLTKP